MCRSPASPGRSSRSFSTVVHHDVRRHLRRRALLAAHRRSLLSPECRPAADRFHLLFGVENSVRWPDVSLLDEAGFSLYETRALVTLTVHGVADAADPLPRGRASRPRRSTRPWRNWPGWAWSRSSARGPGSIRRCRPRWSPSGWCRCARERADDFARRAAQALRGVLAALPGTAARAAHVRGPRAGPGEPREAAPRARGQPRASACSRTSRKATSRAIDRWPARASTCCGASPATPPAPEGRAPRDLRLLQPQRAAPAGLPARAMRPPWRTSPACATRASWATRSTSWTRRP